MGNTKGTDMTILTPNKEHFSKVESERRRRLIMDSSGQNPGELLFLKSLDERFQENSDSYNLIRSAWEYAQGIDYSHGNSDTQKYLNHPLRVASILLENLQIVNDKIITIALLHNVLEVSSLSKEQIGEEFGDSVASAIQALTIDRSRNDRKYLDDYYSNIEMTSRECAAVKVADKLDNIYMICFNPSEKIRDAYLDEIDEYVVPLASRTALELEEDLKVASAVMRSVGFLEKGNELNLLKEEEKI